MCGIFGAIEWDGELAAEKVLRATDSLRHRGPDESGFLFDHLPPQPLPDRTTRFLGKASAAPWQLAFGHRRLSILDLTTGQQPMLDATGAWAISYNGEIYNHLELRHELEREGVKFRTDHSDTETLMLAVAHRGPQVLARLNGMFAAAIYHRDTGRLWLVRDRFGKKPLYLLHGHGRLAFASELKAIVSYLGAAPTLNWDALGDFMMRACIHEPRTIFRDIVKVPAASWIEFDLKTPGGRLVKQERYWEFQPPATLDTARSEADWLAELEHLLSDAVKIRLLSDVPVGAFLSSGLDSATVCALASQHVSEPLRAFTIGTGDAASDESTDAAEIARTLGLRHFSDTCELDPHSLLNEMVTTFDEPFSDLSMAPTMHVAKLASKQVKVVLTGDGADEFFGGYGIFQTMTTHTRWENVPVLAPMVRGIASQMPLGSRGSGFLHRNFRPQGFRRYQQNVESPKMLTLLRPDVAKRINPNWPRLAELWQRSGNFDLLTRVSLLQGMTYLTDDILVKVDRATMAHSVEARSPFLDFRVVELTARMPRSLKLADGRGKVILRRLAQRWFSPEYLNRPKRGFIIPLKKWMQNEMTNELDELATCDILAPKEVNRFVALQRRSQRDFSSLLWRLMVLNRWLKQWRPAITA